MIMEVWLAEVKHTGGIVVVHPSNYTEYNWICSMQGETGVLYKNDELIFLKLLYKHDT